MDTRRMKPWRAVVATGIAATVLLAAPAGDGTGAEAAPAPAPAQAQPEVETVAMGLAVPWDLDFLPDGNALVTERDSARLLEVSPAGEVTVVGTVAGVTPGGEGGLMGVAVSPDFAIDRYVYLYYTAASDNRVVRVTYDDGEMGGQQPIVTGIPKGFIHNGGRIAFGPDGMLYVATGEAGTPSLAQDLSSYGGKILRVRPDGAPAPGNPFGTRVWSYGHRNVQGLAWDGGGRLFATEFGQNALDEVNRIEPGDNYGWPVVEGPGGGDEYTDPVLTWTPAEASPSGAAIVDDALYVAALRGRRVWQVPLTTEGDVGTPQALLTGEYGRLRGAAAAPDGTLWLTTSNRDGRGTPTATDDRILSVTPGDDDPGEGTCVTASNWSHVSNGRATASWIFVRAVGSNDYLGSIFRTTSLRESSPGYWEAVGSC